MWFNTLIDFIINNRTIHYIRLIFLVAIFVAIFVAILENMRRFVIIAKYLNSAYFT